MEISWFQSKHGLGVGHEHIWHPFLYYLQVQENQHSLHFEGGELIYICFS